MKDKMKQLDKEFLADLEAVFGDRRFEFGDHLVGMLFELWARARTPLEVIPEFEELREFKAELRTTVSTMVQETLQGELLNLRVQRAMQDSLEQYSYGIDTALTMALSRVLEFDDKLEGLPNGVRYLITSRTQSGSGGSEYQEFLLPFNENAWVFPNPAPLGRYCDIYSLANLTLSVNGKEQPFSAYWGWRWVWEGDRVASVSGLTADGWLDKVTARYLPVA